jgi:hypothetical protein
MKQRTTRPHKEVQSYQQKGLGQLEKGIRNRPFIQPSIPYYTYVGNTILKSDNVNTDNGITKFQNGYYKTPVEVVSNTSTVTLQVVGGNEKGSLKSQTLRESQGTWTRERLRWQGPAAYTKTNPSSRQRGRHTKTRS